ncbi:hypothetical protein [Microbulbifer taiwanensis]|uniref:Uncharacterized protein n=1 Tax=Microbulbifer taiwanensis TaxID=986746 RepID=A0ABW1YW49_9GAMM|nr:hypothetical protein [Microbulbifer taiwanensis]
MALALVKLLPTLVGWIGQKVSVGTEKARAAIEKQAAIADGWAPQIIVLFWFYPFIAAYIPVEALQVSAAAGLKMLKDAPDWHFEILAGITVAVLGVKRVRRK